ncbi:bruno 1 isoform X6 [Musca autumnalis]|uniref:bruno 1 isoform X6 n=1 Tax=Musca autumnalis TaxID=221902 RepID=UPI003CED3E16
MMLNPNTNVTSNTSSMSTGTLPVLTLSTSLTTPSSSSAASSSLLSNSMLVASTALANYANSYNNNNSSNINSAANSLSDISNRNRQLPTVIENLSNNNCCSINCSASGASSSGSSASSSIGTGGGSGSLTAGAASDAITANNNKNSSNSHSNTHSLASISSNIINNDNNSSSIIINNKNNTTNVSSITTKYSLALHPYASTTAIDAAATAKAIASSLFNSSSLTTPSASSASAGCATTSSTSSTASLLSSFKPYPSINSAYWLPSPHPSPYTIPERKLFIGMLNKKLNENDVRKLFEVHGAIEECTVLRDQNGQSKGCAFVTYATKHSAISAIKTLNQNKTMEGCTSPLVVKFADTQKEKEQKKIQQIQANLWNLATNMNIPLGQTATTVSTPAIMPSTPQQASPVLGADAITPASLQLLQQLQAVGLQQQLLQGLGAQTNAADTTAATAAAAAAGLLPPMTVQNLAALAAMTQSSLTNTANNPGNAQLTNTAALLCLLGKSANTGADANNFASAYMSTAAGLPQFGSTALTTSPLASVALSSAAAAAAGKQIEGPEGCNLFIYHLPQEFTDTDLASTFLPFGNVISAKVFIDKQTNLSKCFGFVSFDNPESAQVAIRAMNGFQVGTKRLKVQLKKPKDASKPY